ncbi:2-Keto-3-deoxy-D-manno-octulosonate-8-phosphate synthase [hydrothermal vent metagenome]|uniref:3-deoxy-8-phosphooctulonate synthase n=1 Tax=hydrothermal vent metagenome TaxID=652676 RepID=A0A3B1E6Y7_9ZZZZ
MIIIAGPCVIESEDILLQIAKELQPLSKNKNINFYFKSSFDKANRTSIDSFRGPGIKHGLEILSKIKKDFGFKILTDIHKTSQIDKAAKVVDIIQIPAFLCRQTDLLVEAAKKDCIINIKKGQFLQPQDMQYQIKKVLNTRGIKNISYDISKKAKIYSTERGFSFGYGNLVVDMRSLYILRQYSPVIFDATHCVQSSSGDGHTSGNRTFVPILARGAAAVGVDGFFYETHIDPDSALSDSANMLDIKSLYSSIDEVLKISKIL